MHQRCTLQGVARSFPLQLPPGDIAKLLIDERDQVSERGLISRFPAHQEFGHRLDGSLGHA